MPGGAPLSHTPLAPWAAREHRTSRDPALQAHLDGSLSPSLQPHRVLPVGQPGKHLTELQIPHRMLSCCQVEFFSPSHSSRSPASPRSLIPTSSSRRLWLVLSTSARSAGGTGDPDPAAPQPAGEMPQRGGGVLSAPRGDAATPQPLPSQCPYKPHPPSGHTHHSANEGTA